MAPINLTSANNNNSINKGKVSELLGHVGLNVPPALLDLAEDGGVAADNNDAGHQEPGVNFTKQIQPEVPKASKF
jgi:hypothetical protein